MIIMIANACFGRGSEEKAMMTSIAYFHNITGELLKKFYFLPVIKRDAKLVKMRLQNTSDIPIVGVYWNKWYFCHYVVMVPQIPSIFLMTVQPAITAATAMRALGEVARV